MDAAGEDNRPPPSAPAPAPASMRLETSMVFSACRAGRCASEEWRCPAPPAVAPLLMLPYTPAPPTPPTAMGVRPTCMVAAEWKRSSALSLLAAATSGRGVVGPECAPSPWPWPCAWGAVVAGGGMLLPEEGGSCTSPGPISCSRAKLCDRPGHAPLSPGTAVPSPPPLLSVAAEEEERMREAPAPRASTSLPSLTPLLLCSVSARP